MLWASILSYFWVLFGNLYCSGYFWRIVLPSRRELTKQGCGVTKITQNFDKKWSCLWTCFGTHFFWKKMEVWINMNDFLSILGSARGAHRGSNEPCSPVLKTLLGPNGPKNHPKAPQGSPRLQKSPGNINFLRFLCGVLTSFVISFWHAIPWQRSKHHKTKQQLR